MSVRLSYAIVPAAGASRRMGVDKLLLPVEGVPLIQRVLSVWLASRVDETVVVLDHKNKALVDVCCTTAAHCILADPTPTEMKHSVQEGLRWIKARFDPQRRDAWLLAPADVPHLSRRVIDRLIDMHDAAHPAIIAPRCQGRTGHPTLFPWSLSSEVFSLADDQGVNRLLGQHAVRYLDTDDRAVLQDIDTPSDYHRLKRPDVRGR